MKNIFLIVVVAALITGAIALATTPQSANVENAEPMSTATVAPTATPRVVLTNWTLTHANYGSVSCPMPKNKTLLSTEKPEINFGSGVVLVEVKGEAYWVDSWTFEQFAYSPSYPQPYLIPEKSGTVYIQPADCTVTIQPKDYNLEIK